MKIGIYGGTFDPPHLGHMEAARFAMGYLGLDQLLLIPNKLPPHKFLAQNGAEEEERLAMTELMADGLGSVATCLDIEIGREGPSYTADTVRALRHKDPDADFYLLMGMDMFLNYASWREAEYIASEVTLVPFAREEGGSHELFAVQTEKLKSEFSARILPLPLENIHPISSTQVRHLLQDENTQDRAGDLLWQPVYGHILRQKLYGTQTELTGLSILRLRAVSYSMMKAKRIPHVKGTEEAAVALAINWGENPDHARRAAILHDCTKYFTLSEHLAICAAYDVVLDEMERKSAKMLHSKSGAALSQYLFGEAPEICQAIACHTTGKAGMTKFEQILYLADYMEPTRQFDGVDELRQLAFSDLDRAMYYGLETTMQELTEKEAPIHRNTLDALAYFRERKA